MKPTGIDLIAAERYEQIEKHGRTIDKDVPIQKVGTGIYAINNSWSFDSGRA